MQGTGNNVRIGEMNAMLMYTIMGDGHGALSNQNFYNDGKPGVAFAPSTWVCLEALIDHARPEIDVWVDGTEVPDLHHTDWPLDNYDSRPLRLREVRRPRHRHLVRRHRDRDRTHRLQLMQPAR